MVNLTFAAKYGIICSMGQDHMSSGSGWVVLGVMVFLGLLVFKWMPEWLWRAAVPDISVNSYIFETHPMWAEETATVTAESAPNVYIRVEEENAADRRAQLVVTVNGEEVEDNCGGERRFCCKMTGVRAGEYEVVAKNTAGEKKIKVVVKIEPPGNTDASRSRRL